MVVTDVRCKSSGRTAGSRVGLSGINIQLSLKKKHAKRKFTTKTVKNLKGPAAHKNRLSSLTKGAVIIDSLGGEGEGGEGVAFCVTINFT